MKHSTFIKLYEERTAKGTWEAWRERHSAEPRWPMLGNISHEAACKLAERLGNIATTTDDLRSFLISKFDAGMATIKTYPEIKPSLLIILMEASGLDWFTYNDQPLVHWSHRLKEHNEQIEASV